MISLGQQDRHGVKGKADAAAVRRDAAAGAERHLGQVFPDGPAADPHTLLLERRRVHLRGDRDRQTVTDDQPLCRQRENGWGRSLCPLPSDYELLSI